MLDEKVAHATVSPHLYLLYIHVYKCVVICYSNSWTPTSWISIWTLSCHLSPTYIVPDTHCMELLSTASHITFWKPLCGKSTSFAIISRHKGHTENGGIRGPVFLTVPCSTKRTEQYQQSSSDVGPLMYDDVLRDRWMPTVLPDAQTKVFICILWYGTQRTNGCQQSFRMHRSVFIRTLCYAKVSSVPYGMVLRGRMGVNSPT